MEHHKICESLHDSTLSKFVTRTWTEVKSLWGGQDSVNKNISFKTPTLRSDLCDHSDAYILVKGGITFESDNPIKKLLFEMLAFNNIVPLINYIFVDNQKILILLCACVIQYNIVKINLWHQEVCGIIIQMKRMILLIKLLLIFGWATTTQQQVNLLSIRQK